jgi:hypothetical protein
LHKRINTKSSIHPKAQLRKYKEVGYLAYEAEVQIETKS